MDLLKDIVEKIKLKSFRHGKKLESNLATMPPEIRAKGNFFIKQYLEFCKKVNKSLDYGIESYMWMINMMIFEQIQLVKTGEYSCKSFEDANRNVYNNPELMDKYMHGLMMSQFLWKHHYKVLEFYLNSVKKYGQDKQIESYLEIGAGHGLFLAEAISILGKNVKYGCLDISEASLNIAKNFIEVDNVDFIQANIFEYDSNLKYDFISMGEVIEHVEDPVRLINSLSKLLTSQGHAFITTPTNAGTIDHIYLFRNKGEIIEVINKAGFNVVEDFYIYSEEMDEERAEKLKIPMMYAAVIKKI